LSSIHPGFADAFEILYETSIQPQGLYELWWSGKPSVIEKYEAPETSFHLDRFSRRVHSSDPYGNEIHSVGFATVALRPGDFYNINDREAVIRRWATWSNNYWNWIQGVQVPLHPVDRWQLRIYVPTTQSPTKEFAENIARRLDERLMPYRLKFRQSSAIHRDTIVIWIERRHCQSVLASLSGVLKTQTFLAKPPPLTKHVGNIGICDHPSDGESVGWMYSEFLWQVIRSGSEDQLIPQLERKGFNPQFPWRLNPNTHPLWDEDLGC
jgi:hypothetical protein